MELNATVDFDANSLSFEEALSQLEQTVARLEAGDLTLEGSLSLFEVGQMLAARCRVLLEQTALRVEQLTEDGELELRDV